MNRSDRARLLIIGLDGATWELLTPMIARGWLPNLGRLAAAGAIAALRSTIPPLTAPAWSSFMTGLNPGRHGVFAFQRGLNRDLERTYVNATAIRGALLWEHLNRHGLTVGVLNMPLTYPLRPLAGWAVSGMLTPSEQSDFTWPVELANVLRARGYTIDLRVLALERAYRRPEQRLTLVDDLRRVLVERQAALEEVLLPRGGDALMVVYETPDRLQHWTWSYIVDLLSEAQLERTPIHAAVEAAYRSLDDCIGRTLAAVAGPETVVFMLSDHGFGSRRTLIHVDEWLASQGLLRYAGGKAGFRKLLKPYMNRLKRLIPRRLLRQGRRAFAVSHVIDWQHTWAYSGVSSEYAIYVNRVGREPFGIVPAGEAYETVRRQIKAGLADLTDPHTGQRVVRAVYDREEAYSGPYVEMAPDIVYELAPGYEPSSEVSAGGVFEDVSAEAEGMHQPDGIFLAYGPHVNVGPVANRPYTPATCREDAVVAQPGLADLAPTILYALGLPVPAGLDGRVLTEIFKPAYCASHPIVFDQTAAQTAPPAASGDMDLSAEDEALIRERLAALGYLR